MSENRCPYGSTSPYQPIKYERSAVMGWAFLKARLKCGSSDGGWMCDMCKEDRADNRTDMLLVVLERGIEVFADERSRG